MRIWNQLRNTPSAGFSSGLNARKSRSRETMWFLRRDFSLAQRAKRRVLVVREDGAKMPADLGGDVYAALADRHNIDPIKGLIKRFILDL